MDKVSKTPRTDAHCKQIIDDALGLEYAATELQYWAEKLEEELDAAQKKNNLLACALRALLSKCPDCGGTGEVGTGIIQIGQPDQMPCFVCAGERQIFLRECGK